MGQHGEDGAPFLPSGQDIGTRARPRASPGFGREHPIDEAGNGLIRVNVPRTIVWIAVPPDEGGDRVSPT